MMWYETRITIANSTALLPKWNFPSNLPNIPKKIKYENKYNRMLIMVIIMLLV